MVTGSDTQTRRGLPCDPKNGIPAVTPCRPTEVLRHSCQAMPTVLQRGVLYESLKTATISTQVSQPLRCAADRVRCRRLRSGGGWGVWCLRSRRHQVRPPHGLPSRAHAFPWAAVNGLQPDSTAALAGLGKTATPASRAALRGSAMAGPRLGARGAGQRPPLPMGGIWGFRVGERGRHDHCAGHLIPTRWAACASPRHALGMALGTGPASAGGLAPQLA